ncbi:MAG: hypothetical protein JNN08_27480 [Bryobacterales bacterium]|nr:hypothetical protein [Bryobacterales bacterium]
MSATNDKFKAKLKVVMTKAEEKAKAELTKLATTHFGKVPLQKSQMAAYTAVVQKELALLEKTLLAEFKTKLKSKTKK